MAYMFLDKKIESGANINEKLAQELHKLVIQNSKEGESMRDFKIILV